MFESRKRIKEKWEELFNTVMPSLKDAIYDYLKKHREYPESTFPYYGPTDSVEKELTMLLRKLADDIESHKVLVYTFTTPNEGEACPVSAHGPARLNTLHVAYYNRKDP